MRWFYGFRVKAKSGEGPFDWVVSSPYATEAEAKTALGSDSMARASDGQHTTPFSADDKTAAEGLCDQNIAL